MSFEVSQSKIKTWRHCRKAYDYKYIQGLTKKHKPMPFLRGTIVHDMLEAHYKGEKPWPVYNKHMEENEKLLRIHAEDYGPLPEHLKNLMKGYFKFYKKEDLKPIAVEGKFQTKLAKGLYLNGIRDMIGESQGLRWMVEHKCHNMIPNNSVVPFNNIQSALYVWAYNKENDKPLDGIMWNYLLGKPLPVPKVLKDGSMSKRKINTTWPIYRAAIKEARLNTKDYLDVKAELAGNEEQVYQRTLVPTNKPLMESVVEDVITTSREMEKLGGKDTTRNLGRDCDWCEFKNLCLAQLKGLDDNFILKSDFKKREKRYDEHKKDSKKN